MLLLNQDSPAWAGSGLRRYRLGLVATVVLLLAVSAMAAEEPKTSPLPKEFAEVARKYAGVVEWQGSFEAVESGSSSGGKAGVTMTPIRLLDYDQ